MAVTPFLSHEQHDQFDRDGFIRLRGVFSPVEASAMEDALWDALGRKHGIARGNDNTWCLPPALGLRRLRGRDVFKPIGNAQLRGTLDSLIGVGRWKTPRYWGSFLMSFPRARGEKSRANFHTDFPYDIPTNRIVGALVLSFINSVPLRAGGTFIIEGSHKLVGRFIEAKPHLKKGKMKFARQALLASDPYLRSLCHGWTEHDWTAELPKFEREVVGVPLRVVELTGESGDIVVGHPWLLHSSAPNYGYQPRFMTVQRIQSADS